MRAIRAESMEATVTEHPTQSRFASVTQGIPSSYMKHMGPVINVSYFSKHSVAFSVDIEGYRAITLGRFVDLNYLS